MNEEIELIKTKLKMCIDEDWNYICDKEHSKILLDYITNLQEIRKEHNIMKQFIYENGLWERFLNDDRFLEHLRSDDSE